MVYLMFFLKENYFIFILGNQFNTAVAAKPLKPNRAAGIDSKSNQKRSDENRGKHIRHLNSLVNSCRTK